MWSLVVCVLLTAIPGLRCSGVNNLPELRDLQQARQNDVAPTHDDMVQAIIPAYSFQCSGRVTQWRTCVQPGGNSNNDRYYIQFQVWRPSSSTSGCYSLVGSNSPVNSDGTDGVLAPEDGASGRLQRCVTLPVPEDEQIDVQEGDVIGYYVDSERSNGNDEAGIQWNTSSSNVVIYYTDGVPREEIRSIYAIDASATDCGAPSDGSASYSISDSMSAAPIISLTVVQLPSSTIDVVVTTDVQPSSATTSSGDNRIMASSNAPSTSDLISTTLSSHGPTTTTELSPPGSTPSPLPTPSLYLSTSSVITPSPSPPLTQQEEVETDDGGGRTDGGGGDGPGVVLVVAIVAVALFVLAILAVLTIIAAIFIRRRRNWKTTALNNPSYLDTKDIVAKQPPSTAAEYDYCGVPAINGGRMGGGGGAGKEERVYATLQQGSHYEVAEPANHLYEQEGTHDYTTIYEDPTSASYVSEIYSTGSVFDSVGTYVPTLEARRRYEMAQPPLETQRYNSLQFFERDVHFWAPASTTLGLYEQLCSKRYREINRNQIKVLKELGSGQFGTVSKGLWMYKNESMIVAVKSLNKSAGEEERVKFLQEAAIMGQFYHPNIVRLHGVVTVGDPVLIVLDYMPNGDMKTYLDKLVVGPKQQARLPKDFLRYSREIAAGMTYLSMKSFVHRDLAARNILLDDRMSCKVGDFGMARDLMDDTYYTSKGGKIPVKWTAPEALLYKKYSTASDVWSYAMVLYEIWSVGEKPFQSLNNSDVVARLQTHQCQPPPSGCPRAVYSIMVDCWNPEANGRPLFDAVFRALREAQEKLLYWSEEDRDAGRHLLKSSSLSPSSSHSFSDLQNKYISHH